MKIRWLNADLTRAELTRGHLWWKEIAEVYHDKKGYTTGNTVNWIYVTPTNPAGWWVEDELDKWLKERRKRHGTWRPKREAVQLAVARLLEGSDS